MPKVSAVFPIYGEKYIEKSVRSLLDQTLDDIEFILVDDRSPDSAYEKVMKITEEDQYAHLKGNIKIIRHDVNRGVPAVRRTGWEASSGDYIYHMDSDDQMAPDMLRRLWEKAVEGDYDIVECKFVRIDEEGHPDCQQDEIPPKTYEDWMESTDSYSLTNKIVRRSVYQNFIIWPENPYLEDYALARQLYFYARKTAFMDDVLYFYCQHPSSIMHRSAVARRVKGMVDQDSILETFIRKNGMYGRYSTFFKVSRANAMVEAWGLPWKEYVKLFPKDNVKVLLCSAVPLKERLGILTKLLGIHGISGKKKG